MRWLIPAKTFLVGEYLAITGAPAILLTTEPCFEVRLLAEQQASTIHPKSPAGLWWTEHGDRYHTLEWHDPYDACGGLGASSAQFIGAYLASLALQGKELGSPFHILSDYLSCAWQGKGSPPSGYDVLAQLSHACVYIHREEKICESYPWLFKELGFLLLHTGKKLATHEHLQQYVLQSHALDALLDIVALAKEAFVQSQSKYLIEAVNAYHEALNSFHLVAPHSLALINDLKKRPEVHAVKGCGALGADVLLVLVDKEVRDILSKSLLEEGWHVLATEDNVYQSIPNRSVRRL